MSYKEIRWMLYRRKEREVMKKLIPFLMICIAMCLLIVPMHASAADRDCLWLHPKLKCLAFLT